MEYWDLPPARMPVERIRGRETGNQFGVALYNLYSICESILVIYILEIIISTSEAVVQYVPRENTICESFICGGAKANHTTIFILPFQQTKVSYIILFKICVGKV